jgi:hypothetical protein
LIAYIKQHVKPGFNDSHPSVNPLLTTQNYFSFILNICKNQAWAGWLAGVMVTLT